MEKIEEDKLINEKDKYKFYCKCGHYTYIYPMEQKNKKVCSWCGNYIYVSKKAEFKERLGKMI